MSATHIRAGEIIARRIDPLTYTYEFTFIGYRDTDSNITFGSGIFDFGDGNSIQTEVTDYQETAVSRNVIKAEYRVVHTYSSPNNYIVSYTEKFRNGGIANMENSINTQFYTETLIVIDPFFGVNNTPVLTVPPIDEGLPGVEFIHNAGAYDVDGDSLAYYFVTPKMDKDQSVILYRELNHPDFYTDFSTGNSQENGPAELTMDEAYGDLVWDAPGDIFSLSGSDCPDGIAECSEYNVAFRVEEWRNVNGQWFRLGYVTRDMQIIVYEGDNEKPELRMPDPLCVTAGDQVQETIEAFDPDGHDVQLEAFGQPFEIAQSATYSPDPPRFQSTPGELDFEWNTVCGHVRERAYEVQFKVTDNPVDPLGNKLGPALVEFGTWEIKVVGPAPNGLNIAPNSGRSVALSWDSYACTNANAIEIWRRVGDFEIEAENCDIGMPSGTGYNLIANISNSGNQFIDAGLAPGAKYCYRIVAKFPLPEGGESYVSDEVCLTLEADAPVITNVDVEKTGEDDGEVRVAWTPAYQINTTQFPEPHTYNIYRSSGSDIDPSDRVTVAERVADTSYTDVGLNTIFTDYAYQVELYDANGLMVDTSAVASSVRLTGTPLLSAVEVSWSANTPWSNFMEEHPYHYIYRDQVIPSAPDQLVLIDSVEVSSQGFVYYDDGSFNDIVLDDELIYCYYVTTQGGYDNPILPDPLVNKSQIVCAQPNDNVPPCPPVDLRVGNSFDCESAIGDRGCGFDEFENVILWDVNLGGTCEDDVIYYRIYFSATGNEEDYALIDSVNMTTYTHENLSSFKGCYRVTAIDRSLNESQPSDVLCIDNCPNFSMPNAFSPDGDGVNDTFTPMYNAGGIPDFDNQQCPRFVLEIDFQVFDRTGRVVYDFDSEAEQSLLINWDGTNTAGQELPGGVYYYSAEVTFDVLNPDNAKQSYNGWVQLFR